MSFFLIKIWFAVLIYVPFLTPSTKLCSLSALKTSSCSVKKKKTFKNHTALRQFICLPPLRVLVHSCECLPQNCLKNQGISSRHGQEQPLRFCYVLCSSVAAEDLLSLLFPLPRQPGHSGQCLSSLSSCWCPGFIGHGGVQVIPEPCEPCKNPHQRAAWLTTTLNARVFDGQGYFGPVWLSLHSKIR